MDAFVYLLAGPPTQSPAPGAGPGIGDTVSLAEPWQWTLPLFLTALLGVATAGGVIWTVVQRHRADARVQLWNRLSWAMDLAVSEKELERQLGMNVVEHTLDTDSLRWSARPPAKLRQYDRKLLRESAKAVYKGGKP